MHCSMFLQGKPTYIHRMYEQTSLPQRRICTDPFLRGVDTNPNAGAKMTIFRKSRLESSFIWR